MLCQRSARSTDDFCRHWPLLRSREVQGDLTFIGAGCKRFKPFFTSDVGDGHWVRQALRSRLLGQWSAGTTDDFSRHGAVEGWHKELPGGAGATCQRGSVRAEILTVDLDNREGYILECDLNNFEELNLNDSSKQQVVSSLDRER